MTLGFIGDNRKLTVSVIEHNTRANLLGWAIAWWKGMMPADKIGQHDAIGAQNGMAIFPIPPSLFAVTVPGPGGYYNE
jgi:hypothetical protein